jgi:hypothetical protein
MAQKLSSRQQAQVAFLERIAPRLPKIYSLVEQLAAPKVDETVLRALGRILEEIKGNASGLSLGPLAETAGRMVMLIRSGGVMAVKVRGLRELHGSLKTNYDAALRSASTPEEEPVE